jgi:hypothetical protein
MKKLFFIISTITLSQIAHAEHRQIFLCPLQFLNQTNDNNDLCMPAPLPELLEHVTLNDAIITLCRLMQGITILSTQPHNAARVGAEVAALIAELMATTTATATRHNLTGNSSLAQVCRSLHADTRWPRPSKPQLPADELEDTQQRERIRDVILASFVNLLTNVAAITAHPHDHKLVASQATLMAANILNAVKETVRSPAHNGEDYENFAQQLMAIVVNEYT